MAKKTRTISFRLDVEVVALLDKRCSLTKQSYGEWVRGVVCTELNRERDHALTDALAGIQLQLADLSAGSSGAQTAFKRLAFLLLTSEGAMAKQDAIEAIRQAFAVQAASRGTDHA